MRLRLDSLLADLLDRPETILGAVDADPMLIRRQSGDLVLANASKALYTPCEEHQLYAKGIVYRREPFRLVSLPLIKIYNAGEREVTVADLAAIASEPNVRLRFLRKMDGSLLQVFRDNGRVIFTTRGMIEGARWKVDDDDEDRQPGFDYLAGAREMASRQHPQLLEDASILDGKTLLFELIHHAARKVTNYGDRADLTLIACFDHRRFAYVAYDELCQIAESSGLAVVESLSFAGDLAAQIDALQSSLVGTDEEGAVLCFERGDEVIYRVKLKSPEYLQLMKLMAFCTYERTLEMIDQKGHIQTWENLRDLLQEQGRSRVPEEILGFYRAHWDRYQAYLADLARLRAWAEGRRDMLSEAVRIAGQPAHEFRKAFAARAIAEPSPALVFAALDGRLDAARLRKIVRSPEEAKEMLGKLGIAGQALP
jgi:RNA ligase